MEGLRLLSDRLQQFNESDKFYRMLMRATESNKYEMPQFKTLSSICEIIQGDENRRLHLLAFVRSVFAMNDCHKSLRAVYLLYVCRDFLKKEDIDELEHKMVRVVDARSMHRIFVTRMLHTFGEYVLESARDPSDHKKLLRICCSLPFQSIYEKYPLTMKCFDIMTSAGVDHMILVQKQIIIMLDDVVHNSHDIEEALIVLEHADNAHERLFSHVQRIDTQSIRKFVRLTMQNFMKKSQVEEDSKTPDIAIVDNPMFLRDLIEFD